MNKQFVKSSRKCSGKARMCHNGAIENIIYSTIHLRKLAMELNNAALTSLNSHAYSLNESIIYGNAFDVICFLGYFVI